MRVSKVFLNEKFEFFLTQCIYNFVSVFIGVSIENNYFIKQCSYIKYMVDINSINNVKIIFILFSEVVILHRIFFIINVWKIDI